MLRVPYRVFVILIAGASMVAAAEKKPAGIWSGDPVGGAVNSTFAFEIHEQSGKLSGKAHVLHEQVEFPLEGVTFADGKLNLDLGQGDTYVGTLDAAGTSFTGTLTVAQMPAALRLARVETLPVLIRPQLPTGKLPYSSEDVTFESPTAKVAPAGTLTIPEGRGPFPAVVIVSGSGPHDRNAAMFGHKPFLILADHLARRGVACLRYDDRGVGKSDGKYAGTTGAEFAADAHAALRYLKTRKEVDPRRIGLCGHSEGGVSAPLVAAEHPDDVAFLVLLASVGVPGEQLLYEQMVVSMQALAEKVDPLEVKKFTTALSTILKSEMSTEEVRAEVLKAFLADAPQEESQLKTHEAGAQMLAGHYSDPGRRWLITSDPAATLRKIRCPVLALGGSKDMICNARQNLAGIKAALHAGGNGNATCAELPGLNHFFQTCETGLLAECPRIEETIAPDALKRIGDWILERK